MWKCLRTMSLETFYRGVFNILYLFLLVTIFILIACFVIIIVNASNNGYILCLKSGCIDTFLIFWEDYKDLIKAFGYCLTLWLACYNLKKFIDVETTKALGDLRTKLNDKEKKVIHTYLFPEEDRTSILKGLNGSSSSVISPPFENADLFDYIGTIVLGAIMVKRGAITLDEFKNQFGYRVENIKENKELMNYLEKYNEYYSDFLYIVKGLDKLNKRQK